MAAKPDTDADVSPTGLIDKMDAQADMIRELDTALTRVFSKGHSHTHKVREVIYATGGDPKVVAILHGIFERANERLT